MPLVRTPNALRFVRRYVDSWVMEPPNVEIKRGVWTRESWGPQKWRIKMGV